MDEAALTVRDYLRAILRRKWLVAVMVGATVGAALVMTLLQPAIYQSEAQILVQPRATSTLFQEQDSEPFAQNLDRAIQTEIRVMEGQQVRLRVRDTLGLGELPPAVSAQAVGATDVVSLVVRSKDARTAQVLADAYVDAYMDIRREQALASLDDATAELQAKIDELQGQIDDLDQQIAGQPSDSLTAQRQALVNQQATFKGRMGELQVDAALTTGGVSDVRTAELPGDPVEPTPKRTLILALIAGLVLGVGAALLVDYLDESLSSAEDVAALGGPPVLAVVPAESPPDRRPIALSSPNSFAVESYRGLRTNVLFLGLDRPLRVLQLTSALPGEGKTTTTSNLAVVLAGAGKQVVVVDADLRKPRLHDVFGAAPMPGLTEVILGHPIDDALRKIDENLYVLTAGSAPANPGEMLLSPRVAAVINELAARFDHVLIDSPPLIPVADAVAVSGAADGVLVVAQAKRTSKRALADALGRLEQVNANVLGVVLNRAATGRAAYRGYGYGYGYGYTSRSKSGAGAAVEAKPPETEHDAPARSVR